MRKMSKRKKYGLILAMVIIAIVVGGVLASYFSSVRVPSEGTVKTVGDIEIYWHANCTSPVTLIDWGLLEPNETKTITVFVLNDANNRLMLSMIVGNWSCVQAETYLDCSWNRESYLLDAKTVVDADITLKVAPDVVNMTDFSFNSIFCGEK